jgi:homoprotocatechuate degradation regulator HpaR
MKSDSKTAARTRSTSSRSSQSAVLHLRDLSRSLPMALMKARESVMQYFRPHHRRHGITEQQWRVLRVLHKAGEIEIADLARQTMLLAPSLSRILRDLVAASMVNRRPVEHDQRRSLVSIGPAGITVLAKVAPLSEASFAAISDRFGTQRLNELFRLLGELEEALRPAPKEISAQRSASANARRARRAQEKSRRIRPIAQRDRATPKPGTAASAKIS